MQSFGVIVRAGAVQTDIERVLRCDVNRIGAFVAGADRRRGKSSHRLLRMLVSEVRTPRVRCINMTDD